MRKKEAPTIWTRQAEERQPPDGNPLGPAERGAWGAAARGNLAVRPRVKAAWRAWWGGMGRPAGLQAGLRQEQDVSQRGGDVFSVISALWGMQKVGTWSRDLGKWGWARWPHKGWVSMAGQGRGPCKPCWCRLTGDEDAIGELMRSSTCCFIWGILLLV